MNQFDTRLHAYRPDLADVALKGQVTAQRFVKGELRAVCVSHAAVRLSPSHDAVRLTEALHGERVRVFDTSADGFTWVQLEADRYVGWIAAGALSDLGPEPTHRVTALRTFAFSRPDIKSEPLQALSLGARVTVTGEAEDRNARYARIAPDGAVVTQHVSPLDAVEQDWAAVAERFVGVPYLWGGKTSGGIDCSGLVQLALDACGIAAPRDSDMQEAALGNPIAGSAGGLQRGDLVFWKGHVGIMLDAERVLHANAFHMQVVAEPLATAIERIARGAGAVTNVRRIEVLNGGSNRPDLPS